MPGTLQTLQRLRSPRCSSSSRTQFQPTPCSCRTTYCADGQDSELQWLSCLQRERPEALRQSPGFESTDDLDVALATKPSLLSRVPASATRRAWASSTTKHRRRMLSDCFRPHCPRASPSRLPAGGQQPDHRGSRLCSLRQPSAHRPWLGAGTDRRRLALHAMRVSARCMQHRDRRGVVSLVLPEACGASGALGHVLAVTATHGCWACWPGTRAAPGVARDRTRWGAPSCRARAGVDAAAHGHRMRRVLQAERPASQAHRRRRLRHAAVPCGAAGGMVCPGPAASVCAQAKRD